MTTKPDDLRTGMWVAIVSSIQEEKDYGFRVITRRNENYPVNGKPLRIVAISLPFIAVSDGTSRFALDIRECDVKKLDKNYVRALKKVQGRGSCDNNDTYYVQETEIIGSKKKKDMRGMCPQCGHKLSELRSKPGIWVYSCRTCGFQGGNSNGGI